jgi:hypothetical protein
MALAGLRMPIAGWVIPELADHPGAEDHTESGQTPRDLGVRVLIKMALELFGDLLELAGQHPDHPDQGRDGGAVGLGDDRGGLQLRLAQDGLQLGGAAVHPALPAGSAQRRGQLGPRQLAAQGRGRRHLQHGQGVAAAQVAPTAASAPG